MRGLWESGCQELPPLWCLITLVQLQFQIPQTYLKMSVEHTSDDAGTQVLSDLRRLRDPAQDVSHRRHTAGYFPPLWKQLGAFQPFRKIVIDALVACDCPGTVTVTLFGVITKGSFLMNMGVLSLDSLYCLPLGNQSLVGCKGSPCFTLLAQDACPFDLKMILVIFQAFTVYSKSKPAGP